jgi:hypothetical protein
MDNTKGGRHSWSGFLVLWIVVWGGSILDYNVLFSDIIVVELFVQEENVSYIRII